MPDSLGWLQSVECDFDLVLACAHRLLSAIRYYSKNFCPRVQQPKEWQPTTSSRVHNYLRSGARVAVSMLLPHGDRWMTAFLTFEDMRAMASVPCTELPMYDCDKYHTEFRDS